MKHNKLSKMERHLEALKNKHVALDAEIVRLSTESPFSALLNHLHITTKKFEKCSVKRKMEQVTAAIARLEAPAPTNLSAVAAETPPMPQALAA